MWLEDLRAQASALRSAGFELIVATPLVDQLELEASGSFNAVEIDPRDHGFTYAPLPFYITLRQFLSVKRALVNALDRAIAGADLVHAGYGGHPVPHGQVAWPIAGRLGRRRIWVFDGADPFPRLELHARQERNPLKRWAKQYRVRRFGRFCRDAMRDADLVFAHNVAVVERFKDVWSERCHMFDRSFVTDQILIDQADLSQRQRTLLDPARPLKLVVAGRQIAIKATDHVLRAMHQARQRGTRLELTVMGDGEDLGKFKSLATELKLNDVVTFAGTVPYGQPLFDAWANADVMVITNLTAEISRNVLLALARGLPLIMYANPGTDALIRDHACGISVPTGDIAALAEAFERACRDRAVLADMAQRGLALARTRTLDATHRRRAELAAQLFEGRV
jgi:glycosyltransferase involved in cell wall biosynthesis